jgi:hypothetical protein
MLVLISGGGISGLAQLEKNRSKKLQQQLLTLLWIETSIVYFGLYHPFLGCILHPSNAIQRSLCALASERMLKSFCDLSTSPIGLLLLCWC